MKNKIIYQLKNKIKLSITGKNINRFIIRLHNNKIEILKCNHINKEKINIIIYEKDYEKLNQIKTIYNIEKLNTYGMIKLKKKINIYKYLIISIILGIIILKILTNIIFKIEIIHSDKKTIEFLKTELKNYGIKEKTFKKSYNQLQKIKEEIQNKYKDKIEWLEIETKGTKYIIRAEIRIIKEKQQQPENRNIIAKKDARILEIKSTQGQILKEINNYVKKGDIIISGNIYDNETIKKTVPAEGIVYGEVWYETDVTYPFIYNEKKELNNKKEVYTLKILNKNIELFNKNPFKNKKIEEKLILKNKLLPIQLVKQNQTEQQIIEQILTPEEAQNYAEEKATKQIKDNLKENEYIINKKILNTNIKEDSIEIKMFFSVYENITSYEPINYENE